MGLIPEDIIQQVLDRSNVVDVIGAYVPLKRAGHNFKTLCPFHHEKTPSFMVNPQKQIYHCFGCGAGGNVISFVMAQEHVEFPEAVRLLAQKAGVPLPRQTGTAAKTAALRDQITQVNDLARQFYYRQLFFNKDPAARAARDYLKKRGLKAETAKMFQLGFAPDKWDTLMRHLQQQGISFGLMEKAGLIIGQNRSDGFHDRFRQRIMFPIVDVKGRCVAFGGRSLDKNNPAKYMNSPETPVYVKGHHLYGLRMAKDEIVRQDRVVIVEGYLDFMTPFQEGVQNIVASLGTALTLEQVRLLRRYTNNFVMLFDSDQAGEAAMVRSLDLLVEEGMNVQVAILPPGQDPDSFVRECGPEKFRDRIRAALSLFDFKLKTVLNRIDTKTIEGRAAVASEMLQTVSKFAHEIVKSEYIRKLAGALSVSEGALIAEMKRMSGAAVKGRETGASLPREKRAPLPPVEKNILRLMLEEHDYIPLIREEVRPEDFNNEQVRLIVRRVFELFGQGRTEISPSELTSHFDDQEIVRIISELMAAEDLLIGDRNKIHADCIRRLKQDRLKTERQKLLKEIETAQKMGDHSQVEKLMQDFNQLIKG